MEKKNNNIRKDGQCSVTITGESHLLPCDAQVMQLLVFRIPLPSLCSCFCLITGIRTPSLLVAVKQSTHPAVCHPTAGSQAEDAQRQSSSLQLCITIRLSPPHTPSADQTDSYIGYTDPPQDCLQLKENTSSCLEKSLKIDKDKKL